MKLAVVIPAYKETFFHKALSSLAAQTNRHFTVYVGDDCSPADLKSIADRFCSSLDLHYTRFSDNVGGKNLVKQWQRCIDLTQDEEWLWLFSDDDLASPNCVEVFYREQAKHPSDVYRFNTRVIDENDRETSGTLRSPDHESSERMAYNLLYWRRGNSMPDHVFSRDVYERKGGFVDTPFAQGADWATSILFSQDTGMQVLQDGLISWRRSNNNVSAVSSRNKRAMLEGHYRFIEWVLQHFEYLHEHDVDGISYEMIRYAAAQNLSEVIAKHYRGLPFWMYGRHVHFMRSRFGMPSREALRHLLSTVYQSTKGRPSRRGNFLWKLTERARGQA
jgi:glycosyltransferase involved in cell wall biosynthesis